MIGKRSFEDRALLENYAAVIEEIIRAKPSVAKGRYLRSITIASTQGPGVKVDPTPHPRHRRGGARSQLRSADSEDPRQTLSPGQERNEPRPESRGDRADRRRHHSSRRRSSRSTTAASPSRRPTRCATGCATADATFRVVKNSLTERAADAGRRRALKPLLEGPTALTFVRGDAAAAAKAIADFARTTQLLAFKGGLMDGAALSLRRRHLDLAPALARRPLRPARRPRREPDRRTRPHAERADRRPRGRRLAACWRRGRRPEPAPAAAAPAAEAEAASATEAAPEADAPTEAEARDRDAAGGRGAGRARRRQRRWRRRRGAGGARRGRR